MLQLWIVAIIITTTGWPQTPYLHLGFFLLWHINKEEEAGSSLVFHHTLVLGRLRTQGLGRTSSNAVSAGEGGRREQLGTGPSLHLQQLPPPSAAAPVALCLHELEQAALGLLLFNSHWRVVSPPCPTALKWVCQNQLKSGWQETLRLCVQRSIFLPTPQKCWALWTPSLQLHFSKLHFSEIDKKYIHTLQNICSAEK